MTLARAEVPNPDSRLRAKMFAQARILVSNTEGALLIPRSAVQSLEQLRFVFVKTADDLFEARAIRPGARFNGQIQVLDGLKPQEQIVVNHGFALKSALLISRLGAGCADD
jgi:cobalt-zinc-cadmium efflux system membrane fusion protein